MASPFSGIRRIFLHLRRGIGGLWRRFRSLRKRYQWAIGIVIALLIIALAVFGSKNPAIDTGSYERTVTLASVSSLSGGGSSGSALGTVRSITEAKLLSQTGGTVRRVNATIGSSVGAGSVIAELENASERAAVLQAEGSYEAAVAAQSVSKTNVATDIRSSYQSFFSDIDTALETQIDLFFGEPTGMGPDLVINADGDDTKYLMETRRGITTLMSQWRAKLANAESQSPETLLRDLESMINVIAPFTTRLAQAANARDSGATATQLAALSTARATITGIASQIATLRDDYEAEKTGTSATSASEASVKQALGSLRLAQAALEKTVVRAPIAGTVNFLPVHVGDYVTAFTHVATVAQNGALEVVVYISEDQRAALEIGEKVMVEDTHPGVVTSIAPALDPVTKQIEMHVAVEGSPEELVNGQSVRVSVPTIETPAGTAGPLLLPLPAVKLYADSRVVFTVNAEGRLVAQEVETGEVRGDRIEILSPLSGDLRIVSDARGLSAGEKVKISNGP